MKHLSCRKNCFQEVTHFWQDKNVEAAHAFNADVFLLKDASVFQIS
jgi:hypothetical protein